MIRYETLIVGGGMTAAAAVEGVREVDAAGTIGVMSLESHPPYNRPPLSKKLWRGKPEASIWRALPDEHLDLLLNCRVVRLDPRNKVVQTEDGETYSYSRLLLATGGRPRRLPFAPPETVYYRTLDDYHTVRAWTGKGARIGVIGGGFIGSEIAAALAMNGEQAVMVFPEAGLGARIFPADLSQYMTEHYREQGVEVHAGVTVQAIDRRGDGFVLRGKAGEEISVDHIIAGIGIHPNVELAESAGISVVSPNGGGGILVDKYLRTNQPDIYAAGDVASFFSPALARIVRVEHADNASSMGRVAGLNLAGQTTPYKTLPFFYSDLFEHGYEAVGDLDSRLQTIAEWQEPFQKGVIYYLRSRQVRGVLLWNTWDQVDAARKLIEEGRSYRQAGALLPLTDGASVV